MEYKTLEWNKRRNVRGTLKFNKESKVGESTSPANNLFKKLEPIWRLRSAYCSIERDPRLPARTQYQVLVGRRPLV